MRVVIPAVLVVTFASPAYPDEAAAWAGMGTTSCTAYAQAYKQDPVRLEDLYFVWAQGFMSGLNTRHVPSHEETDLLSKTFPSQAQERFIQRYCD